MGFSEVCFMKPESRVRGRKSELHAGRIFGAAHQVQCCSLVSTKK